ncbi:5-formyltetrahydrofolate cyclo-ligase [Weissella minor]|uniref:5-formyltetrahydrofolate cyclo-ligase n=1 Tax=Weissella minor TaxID=1620 RepID=A0A0R2JKK6_9LACO|nr:5-formyltetrahydrofolate cyclo-ligase [Weissella minor]KRN77769.1 5-formyltetrahydrofolate cyclo-ligase [Weissella minor]
MIDKKIWRDNALQHLKNLTDQQRIAYQQALTTQIMQTPTFQAADVVALTLSQDVELSTQLLIQNALIQQKQVLLPRIKPARQMDFIKINEMTTYERHKFGMLEPVGESFEQLTAIDFVLVPGLAFSAAGDRLGFGGGYYDRWLPKLPQAHTVGVTLQENFYEQTPWPIEETDQRVKQVISLESE